jgi:putative ABC transport system substrate-binding protein
MNRRCFIKLLAGAAAGLAIAWPPAALSQQPGKVKRIGFISEGTVASMRGRFACFNEGLAKLGWIDGQNIAIEQISGQGNSDLLPGLAGDLVRSRPDLVVSSGTTASQTMQRATRELPVVFVMVSDPVASGIVKSLARPEANVTGFSNFLPATTPKLLEFIKAVAPKASRVAFLYDPTNAGKRLELEELRGGVKSLRMSIEPHGVRTPAEIEAAFAAMSKSRPGALIVPSDNVTLASLPKIVALAARMRIPAIYQSREFVDGGGFMSYGLNVCQHYRRAANHVDRIFKGAKPAELPVELPTTFELMINLNAARALGVKVPPALLVRADEVIE